MFEKDALDELKKVRLELQAIRRCLEPGAADRELYVKVREPYQDHYRFITLKDHLAQRSMPDKNSRQ